MTEPNELVRQQTWACAGPAELELSVDVGSVRVELAAGEDAVRVELRRDPSVGAGWTQGISGLISWIGTAGPFDTGQCDAATLAADAVTAAEISWSDAARRLVVRNSEELPLRVVPLAVTVHAPEGSRLSVRTGAGEVTVSGPAGDSDVKTGSGDVDLDAVAGRARVRTGSGAVALAAVSGRTDIKAGSGDVRVGETDGELHVRTGSGDVAVADARAGTLEIATGSGRLTVAVHQGVGAELDLSSGSGRARTELDLDTVAPAVAPTLRVRGRTGSGDVLVTRAVARV